MTHTSFELLIKILLLKKENTQRRTDYVQDKAQKESIKYSFYDKRHMGLLVVAGKLSRKII